MSDTVFNLTASLVFISAMALIAYGIHTDAETRIAVAKITAECKR